MIEGLRKIDRTDVTPPPEVLRELSDDSIENEGRLNAVLAQIQSLTEQREQLVSDISLLKSDIEQLEVAADMSGTTDTAADSQKEMKEQLAKSVKRLNAFMEDLTSVESKIAQCREIEKQLREMKNDYTEEIQRRFN